MRHLQASLGAGAFGDLALDVVQVLYLPVLVVWSIAYLLGSGFSVGAHTHVGPGHLVLGQLPAVPLLAALPASPVAGGWLVVAVPLLAGGLAARTLVRRGLTGPAHVAATTAWTALVVGVVALVAAGSLGPGRLEHIGTSAWRSALAAALTVGAGCGGGVLAHHWWSARTGLAEALRTAASDEPVEHVEQSNVIVTTAEVAPAAAPAATPAEPPAVTTRRDSAA